MKNLDPKKLQLPLNSVNLPATVSGINRNSPSRASIKIVLPPVIPNPEKNVASSSIHVNSAPVQTKQGPSRQLVEQPYYDANNYYNIKPSMQQIPEQSQISIFSCESANENERISPGSMNEQFKFNRYSSSSLDSGRGSDSIKFATGQSNRVSVHSCESIGSASSNKDSESSQQSPSLSSSSSTSSSFCSSSSSSSSHVNQYSNRTLSASSSVSEPNAIGDGVTHANNVFMTNKNNIYANMMPIRRSAPSTSEIGNNMQNLVAQAGPPSIAEMILHGISDPEIIHNWLQKINMAQYETNFINAAYDMATIAKMTPQDLMAIGITDPKSRSVFTAEIQKLNFPEGIPSYKPDSLEEWLKLLNLFCYYGSLCQQGYSTIDRVTELTWEDLEDVGINKLGHQKKILLAIKKVKLLKSKVANTNSANHNNEPIYCSNSSLKCNDTYSDYQPKEATTFATPTIMPSHQPSVPVMISTYPLPLPYQDVPIKMYASAKLASPTQVAPSEFRTVINANNVVPSTIFNSKPQMRTFQQMSDMNQFNYNPSQQVSTTNLPYGASGSSLNNSPLAYRGRSLESLDAPDLNYYTNYQYYHPDSAYKPPYQYSNGDLPSITRQTVCYETNPAINTFMNQFSNQNYEIDGTATLNRPKNLIKNKPVAKIVGNTRQSDIYDNYDTSSIKSNESSDKMSQNSETNSDTSSLYSTLKKKPPPPPKRVNSVRKPNSLPSTPLHLSDQPGGSFPDQVYSNLMYLNSNYYDNNSAYNEDVFASCVKNLTNKFAEIHSLSTDDNISSSRLNHVESVHTHTLPMNKKEQSMIESCPDTVNASSSSSTESMPFANDNVGTIRQKTSNFMQNALKLSDPSTKFSSSSSSSSSTSSPMYSKTVSLPNSTLNSPLSAVASNNFHLNYNYPVQTPGTSSKDNNHQNVAIKSDSRQNVVDSLEDIEIMLANLKTQLDSIE